VNKEEILAMEAGKALNMLIAEKVMGLIAWEEKRGGYTHIVFQKPEDNEPYKRSRNWEKEMDRYKRIEYSEINNHIHVVQEINYYSTDISDAWEVLGKMRRPFSTRKKFANAMYEITNTNLEDMIVSPLEVIWNMNPLNICKASLLAVM
jgi:hypothetical protein